VCIDIDAVSTDRELARRRRESTRRAPLGVRAPVSDERGGDDPEDARIPIGTLNIPIMWHTAVSSARLPERV
jgi:hypothetical protein